MSYDDVPEIRALYRDFQQVAFNLGHSAHARRLGEELLIFKMSVVFPDRWKSRIPHRYITAADGVRIPVAG